MKHTKDCGVNHPRGCRPNCNCWCHEGKKIVKTGKDTFKFVKGGDSEQ